MSANLETPAAPDGWEFARDILALVAQPKRATRLLNELQRRMNDVTAAEAKLAAARASHEQTVAKERAELEDRRTKLIAKEANLLGRESLAEKILARAEHNGQQCVVEWRTEPG
jgi:hypothetical protein